ncbi:MAG: hypothetical protein R3351_09795 [Nitrospirales bacterium]|nr:hypothetical protein [Nitrospirales bacterium]
MTQESSKKNTYQLSGVDAHERGFTRQVEISSHQGLFHAVLRYEKLKVSGEPCVEEDAALRELIQKLQDQGYTQLRTQLIFRGTDYLGSQEMWADYPDREMSTASENKLLHWIRRWCNYFRSMREE